MERRRKRIAGAERSHVEGVKPSWIFYCLSNARGGGISKHGTDCRARRRCLCGGCQVDQCGQSIDTREVRDCRDQLASAATSGWWSQRARRISCAILCAG